MPVADLDSVKQIQVQTGFLLHWNNIEADRTHAIMPEDQNTCLSCRSPDPDCLTKNSQGKQSVPLPHCSQVCCRRGHSLPSNGLDPRSNPTCPSGSSPPGRNSLASLSRPSGSPSWAPRSTSCGCPPSRRRLGTAAVGAIDTIRVTCWNTPHQQQSAADLTDESKGVSVQQTSPGDPWYEVDTAETPLG